MDEASMTLKPKLGNKFSLNKIISLARNIFKSLNFVFITICQTNSVAYRHEILCHVYYLEWMKMKKTQDVPRIKKENFEIFLSSQNKRKKTHSSQLSLLGLLFWSFFKRNQFSLIFYANFEITELSSSTSSTSLSARPRHPRQLSVRWTNFENVAAKLSF